MVTLKPPLSRALPLLLDTHGPSSVFKTVLSPPGVLATLRLPEGGPHRGETLRNLLQVIRGRVGGGASMARSLPLARALGPWLGGPAEPGWGVRGREVCGGRCNWQRSVLPGQGWGGGRSGVGMERDRWPGRHPSLVRADSRPRHGLCWATRRDGGSRQTCPSGKLGGRKLSLPQAAPGESSLSASDRTSSLWS